MDLSRSSSYSARSTNSYGLKRIMIIRTMNDLKDKAKKERSELLYKERRQERLKEAGVKNLTVKFDSVQIREYPMILGCNPAVSQGPPLEIDWEYVDEETWNFNQYEKTRPERRRYLEMNIPMDMRIRILQRSGETLKRINQISKEMKAVRIKRLETSQSLYRSKTHEKVEMLGRGLRNFFTDKKKKEKELLAKTKSLGDIAEEDAGTEEETSNEA